MNVCKKSSTRVESSVYLYSKCTKTYPSEI